MRQCVFGFGCALLLTAVLGCATNGADGEAAKRQAILDMKEEALSHLFSARPELKAQVREAPGYGVFSNANVNLVLASVSGGEGVVEDNHRRTHTFMKMGEVGIGLGLGVKDFRAVLVFHDRETMEKFVNSGWEFGAHADAAAKAGTRGGAVAGELLLDGITVYQLTESGLALQATIKGTKYWKDSALN